MKKVIKQTGVQTANFYPLTVKTVKEDNTFTTSIYCFKGNDEFTLLEIPGEPGKRSPHSQGVKIATQYIFLKVGENRQLVAPDQIYQHFPLPPFIDPLNITDSPSAEAILNLMYTILGDAFHPDTPCIDYEWDGGPIFSPAAAKQLDKCLLKADKLLYKNGTDIYGLCLNILQKKENKVIQYTAHYLNSLPTIEQGHTDNLKIGTDTTRVWLSRYTMADGQPYNRSITIERIINGKWEVVDTYPG